jgi:hypothetical protein
MQRKARTTPDGGSRQASRNHVLFREVNERVREVIAPLLAAGEEAEFLCECGDEACIETIRLDLEEYRAVRVSPHRFIMVPGHEDGIGEATVHDGRFVVVERREWLEHAPSHDPVERAAESG